MGFYVTLAMLLYQSAADTTEHSFATSVQVAHYKLPTATSSKTYNGNVTLISYHVKKTLVAILEHLN